MFSVVGDVERRFPNWALQELAIDSHPQQAQLSHDHHLDSVFFKFDIIMGFFLPAPFSTCYLYCYSSIFEINDHHPMGSVHHACLTSKYYQYSL